MLLSELKCIENNINIEEYLNFYINVHSQMLNKEWLGKFSYEDIKNILEEDGKIWMYYLDKEVVCSMMYIKATDKILKDFKIPYLPEEVGECGPIMVNNKYIGNGLQKQMLKVLDQHCIDNGKKFILTTIHPDNIYSINNFLKLNYQYSNSFKFKRGKRDLYIKNLI